ncbi:MAG: FAD:protein FMN transferase, partial [Elusimicrobiota bacterium]|nr:FAD:protein FMN transferase [Elusimicrobiota bacterium]
MKKAIIFGIRILLIGAVFGCARFNHKEPEIIKRTRFLMDTVCTIQVPGKTEEVDKIIDSAFNRMEEIDQKFNCLNPKSPLYQFNNKRIPIVDSELIQLIKIACKVSEESAGAFDITVEPLVNLWGFYTKNPSLPAKDDIRKCLKKIGYKHLVINDKKITSDDTKVMIDLGGIAKGYAIQ